jgi:predicted amidohydrolase
MSDHLRVRLVQWGSGLDPAANRARLQEGVAGETDLVVFPEVFMRDYGTAGSDVSGFAEPLDGPFVTELERVARAAGTTAAAGMFEQSDDPTRPLNTLVVRGNTEASYNKIHLYDSFGYRESERITGGAIEPQVIDVNGWKVGLMICYDLRFPELSRLLVEAGAEVLVVPAAWLAGPHKLHHWRTLVQARAIENTVFVIGVGQPEPRYCGHSVAVGPLGQVLAEAGGDDEVLDVVLHRADLDEARTTNPALSHRRL